MKNKKWMTKISTAIMAAVLCSNVSLQAVMADTDTAPAAETGTVAGTDTEENGPPISSPAMTTLPSSIAR